MPDLSVLVVEDNDAVRHMLGLALRGLGYSTQLASCGNEAVDIYGRVTIDFVLMDVQMPDMTGPETFASLKKIDPNVVCCFMSGHLGEYAEADLLKLGSVGLIQKPFPIDQLNQLILRLARSTGKTSELRECDLPKPERRAFPRSSPSSEVKISCFESGPNVAQSQAIAIHDFSKQGLRLLLKAPLEIGKSVFITIERPFYDLPVSSSGTIVWLREATTAAYSAGAYLDRPLTPAEMKQLN